MKKEDKIAYGIVALGICVGLPIFIFAINKRSPLPVATKSQPAAPEIANTPLAADKLKTGSIAANKAAPSAKSSASIHQTNLQTTKQDNPPTTDRPVGTVTAPQQAGQGSQNEPDVAPKQPDFDADRLAPKLSIAVVATLGKEGVAPFVLKYNPSYNSADAQSLSESLWNSSSGNVKTTIRNPKYDIYTVLSKASGSPFAVGLAFPINKSGWILIPAEFIARMIKPDKPVSEKIQAGLNRFHRILSLKLYATGDCSGLLQFENGNGMRIDIKEDPEFPESLIFKTTFLPKGTYNVPQFDSELVLALQDGVSIQTVSHGKIRPDGWSTFETPRYMD